MPSASSAGERHGQFEPFLPSANSEHAEESATNHSDVLTAGQAWRLYLSHFLSMWNSRAYEYGAILFIQAAFPGNLLPSSINASTRLRPLLLTIFVNRITLVVCCMLWLLLSSAAHEPTRKSLFAIILLLGMIEKVSPNVEDRDYSLTHMNTAMRRLDIACKLTAPLAISSVVAVVKPTRVMVAIAIVSSVSVVVESGIVLSVWRNNNRLQIGKAHKQENRFCGPTYPKQSDPASIVVRVLMRGYELLRGLRAVVQANNSGLRYYFSTIVWLPSICVAVMHGSSLAWSGTLVTWLLNEHFSLAEVTIAKGVGSVFEIGSTFVFPWAVAMLLRTGSGQQTTSYHLVEQRSIHNVDEEAPSRIHDYEDLINMPDVDLAEDNELIGHRELHAAVIRVAYWSITTFFLFLVPTTIALFTLNHFINASSTVESETDSLSPLSTSTTIVIAAITFWSFLSLSYLGRWTYDLAVTQLTQMLVPSTHRATFGGTEQAIVSVASLAHWVATAIWHQQGDFVWLALASVIGIGVATAVYVWWMRDSGLK